MALFIPQKKKIIADYMELGSYGLTVGGDVQIFHTANVLRRIVRYMPYRSGTTSKLTQIQTDISKPYVITDVLYGKYLYYGKVMVGSPPKRATNRDLNYTKTKNQQAGPYWGRTLVAAEGSAMQGDLQRYVDRKAGRR